MPRDCVGVALDWQSEVTPTQSLGMVLIARLPWDPEPVPLFALGLRCMLLTLSCLSWLGIHSVLRFGWP
jgi:hypothetical protein